MTLTIYLIVGWVLVYLSVGFFFDFIKDIHTLRNDWEKEDLKDFRKQLRATIYSLFKLLFALVLGFVLINISLAE